MKYNQLYLLMLVICFTICCKCSTINKKEDKMKTDLDKVKLLVLLNEALADDKLGGVMIKDGLDVSTYNDVTYDLICIENGKWRYGPWTIVRISGNVYELHAAEAFYLFRIRFETGEKYVLKDWDYSMVEFIEGP